MAEKDELNLDSSSENETPNKIEERLKDLSSKVKLTAQERDEKDVLLKKSESEKEMISKERDFFQSFTDSTSRYPNANQFRDKIKEKVMAGYSVEDATVSVLAKEGKLTTPAPERESPAGGSASTTSLSQSSSKPLEEMTREEKRQALIDREGEDGSLSRILERKSIA